VCANEDADTEVPGPEELVAGGRHFWRVMRRGVQGILRPVVPALAESCWAGYGAARWLSRRETLPSVGRGHRRPAPPV
jgi:hypothetical protein